MKYHVTGGREPIVEFTCPTCMASLQSPLQDAGQQYGCPTCAHILIVPGGDEVERRAAIDQKRAAAAEQRQRAEIAAAEDRRRTEIVRQADERSAQTARVDYRKSIEKTEAQRAGFRLRAADIVLCIIGCGYAAMAIMVLIIAAYASSKGKLLTTEMLVYMIVLFAAFAGAAILFWGAGAALKMLAIMGERGEKTQ